MCKNPILRKPFVSWAGGEWGDPWSFDHIERASAKHTHYMYLYTLQAETNNNLIEKFQRPALAMVLWNGYVCGCVCCSCRPVFLRCLARYCSLLAFELQRPHIDALEVQLYRAVSGLWTNLAVLLRAFITPRRRENGCRATL